MMIDFVFLTLAAMATTSAFGMVVSRNPVSSLMFLVMTFFSLSGIFVLFDAHFLAAVQIIVYAGAIMVLFLFVIMLLNLGHIRKTDVRGTGGKMLAMIGGSLLFALLGGYIIRGTKTTMAGGMGEETYEALLRSRGAVGAVADPLFNNYLVPFEVTSLLLLVAMVGSIVLARRKAP
jgi:NADH-quinone oxidoreductase subunit J